MLIICSCFVKISTNANSTGITAISTPCATTHKVDTTASAKMDTKEVDDRMIATVSMREDSKLCLKSFSGILLSLSHHVTGVQA